MNDDYNDIIDLPYKKSEKYAHMSISDRAAQFAPFSALTGYSDVVDEVGRLTSSRIELDEYEVELINRELKYVLDNIAQKPLATVTYFVPDKKKSGGKYNTVKDRISNIDEYEHTVELLSGVIIPMDQIMTLKIEKE